MEENNIFINGNKNNFVKNNMRLRGKIQHILPQKPLTIKISYNCINCNFMTNIIEEYNNHIKECLEEINLDKDNNFVCKKCNFITSNKKDYNRHINTIKHKNNDKIYICKCGKNYKHRASLYNHKKSCSNINNIIEGNNGTIYEENNSNIVDDNINVVEEACNMLYNRDYENISENTGQNNNNINYNNLINTLMNENKELRKTITKIIPKIGNNNTTHNKFNLNVFLHEECKDAININDFLKSIQIQMEDLEVTKNNSLEYGINNIFTKALTNIDVYKRPIHCTDTKRKILYVKDKNNWEIDNEYKSLKNSINEVVNKQRKSIKEWEKLNPNWEKNEKLQEEYAKLVKNSTCELDDNQEVKIIKNIADNVICNN